MISLKIKSAVAGDSLLATLGITAAVDPSIFPVFYETIEWKSIVALLGILATAMVIRHAYYATKRLRLDIDRIEKNADDKTEGKS